MSKITSLASLTLAAVLLAPRAAFHAAEPKRVDLSAIASPIIFRGDATTAYRDCAALYPEKAASGSLMSKPLACAVVNSPTTEVPCSLCVAG